MTSQTNIKLQDCNQKTKNIKDNLLAQADKLFRQTNQHSIKTRYRYYAAEERFAEFLAEKYKLQKLKNIKGRHLEEYVKYLKETGKSPSTIKTDLAGIRFFHELSESRNKLPNNDKLDIEKREIGKLDRSWTEKEYKKAIDIAYSMGRMDVALGMKMAYNYGLRIEEVCRCQVSHLIEAKNMDYLYVKGKNGQVRGVSIDETEKKKLLEDLLEYAKKENRKGTDRVLFDNYKSATQKEKKAIENWISNHRWKFQNEERNLSSNKISNLNFHGLRHTYAQNEYNNYIENQMNENLAKKKVSEQLGHHRKEVTKVYLTSEN